MGQNISKTLGRQFLAGLLQLGIVVLIARTYGPSVNGIYAITMLLPGLLAAFLNLGMAPANVYYLGKREYSALAVFKTNLQIGSIIAFVGLIGGSVLILYQQELFIGASKFMLFLALLILPISLIRGFLSSIFIGLQQFKEFNITVISQPFVALLFVATIVILGINNIYLLILANLLGELASLILALFFLKRYLKFENRKKYKVKTAIGYGYKAHLSNILAYVNYKADIFLVNLFTGPSFTGIYVIAVALSERLWMLSKAVSTVALPRLSELHEDEEKRKKLTPLLTRLTLFATTIAAGILALIAYPFIVLVFGIKFEPSAYALFLLLPGVVAGAGSRILFNDIAARGRPELNMYVSVFTLAINILGNIWLIPLYGILGAAFATTVAYSFNFILGLYIYWRETKIAPTSVILICSKDLAMIRSLIETKTPSRDDVKNAKN